MSQEQSVHHKGYHWLGKQVKLRDGRSGVVQKMKQGCGLYNSYGFVFGALHCFTRYAKIKLTNGVIVNELRMDLEMMDRMQNHSQSTHAEVCFEQTDLADSYGFLN